MDKIKSVLELTDEELYDIADNISSSKSNGFKNER